jgi:transposase
MREPINWLLDENAIRPFALGRKAWLLADTSQGPSSSATCYSLSRLTRWRS